MLLKCTVIFVWKSTHVFQYFFSLHFLDNFQDTCCNVLVLNFGNASLSASTITKKQFSSFTVLVTQCQFSVLFACENNQLCSFSQHYFHDKTSEHDYIHVLSTPLGGCAKMAEEVGSELVALISDHLSKVK
jgi:hypothetical protein